MKKLLTLMVAGLLCWASQVSATTITLDNGTVKYVINETGVVDAGFSAGPDTLNLFNITVYYTYLGVEGHVTLGDAPTSYDGSAANSNGYDGKQYRFATLKTIGGKDAALEAKYCLQAGKRYLDIRYSLWLPEAGPVTITGVRSYQTMQTISGNLRTSVESPVSASQSINDKDINVWTAGAGWTVPNRALYVGQVGFISRVPNDDYMGNTIAAVNAAIASDNLSNTVVSTADNAGALCMRVPTKTPYLKDPDVPGTFYVESRLEVVPEPCTMGLMLAGLAGLGVMRRRNGKA